MTSSMSVGELKKQFKDNFGSSLRVYKGGRVADDTLALSEIGLKADGTLECRSSLTVAGFIDRMANDHGLKVKVYTCDEWVACLDGLTLESTGKVKKSAVKADMESMIAYQRRDNEDSADDADFEECEDPIGECFVENVSYDIFPECAFAQYLEDEEVNSVTIPDYVEFEGKQYPVTYWGAGSETVESLELGANVKEVDSLHADCENIVEIIVHSPKGYIVANDDEDEEMTLEQCYPKAKIKYVSQQKDQAALPVANDNKIVEAKKCADIAIEEAKSKKGLLNRIIDKILG